MEMPTTFKHFLAKEMHDVQYDYSSTQVNLPKDLSHEILSWSQDEVPENIIFKDPNDPSFGREDEIHVTVLYGLHTTDPEKVRLAVSGQKPFDCKLGKLSLFETNPKFDVLKIEVHSEGLRRLNKTLKNSGLKLTETYPVYVPHVTIAYVQKGKAAKYVGDRVFDGKKFHVAEILFSGKDGKKTKIQLGEK